MLQSQIDMQHLMQYYCTTDLHPALFKYQRDGSLSSVSCEAITQVMSKEFIRNNYANFRSMYDKFSKLRISACHGSSCGMHINISNACFGGPKDYANAIRKFYYFINKNFSISCILVHRDESRTGVYCRRMEYDKNYAKNLDLENQVSCHGVCFNLGHYKTGRIELRLVGGQKDYYCFRNTLETVFFLVERMKDISWNDIDDLTKVFNGCNQYVIKRLQDVYDNNLIDYNQFNTIKENSQNVDFGCN